MLRKEQAVSSQFPFSQLAQWRLVKAKGKQKGKEEKRKMPDFWHGSLLLTLPSAVTGAVRLTHMDQQFSEMGWVTERLPPFAAPTGTQGGTRETGQSQ